MPLFYRKLTTVICASNHDVVWLMGILWSVHVFVVGCGSPVG